jgi:hypothetical protein
MTPLNYNSSKEGTQGRNFIFKFVANCDNMLFKKKEPGFFT